MSAPPEADMSGRRLQRYQALLSNFEASLSAFQSSKAQFQVLKTVQHVPTIQQPDLIRIQDPESPENASATSPRILYILDSSFNPPSIAHRTLALSALSQTSVAKHHSPIRLLLLFAVLNADKAGASPAPFPHRLTMMTIFAEDLLRQIYSGSTTEDDSPADSASVPIDIGVTKAPYYTDKSNAIASTSAGPVSSSSEDAHASDSFYPDSPKHIHLLGFDTLTRFFNPKYYSDSDPPLSAIAPYFDAGHALRATLRPDESGATAAESESEQRAWLKRLADGDMEVQGGRREWARHVELVGPNKRVGVSSTKIRRAAQIGQWEEVRALCCEGVEEWIREKRLYDGK